MLRDLKLQQNFVRWNVNYNFEAVNFFKIIIVENEWNYSNRFLAKEANQQCMERSIRRHHLFRFLIIWYYHVHAWPGYCHSHVDCAQLSDSTREGEETWAHIWKHVPFIFIRKWTGDDNRIHSNGKVSFESNPWSNHWVEYPSRMLGALLMTMW